jgi:hypothetical protein
VQSDCCCGYFGQDCSVNDFFFAMYDVSRTGKFQSYEEDNSQGYNWFSHAAGYGDAPDSMWFFTVPAGMSFMALHTCGGSCTQRLMNGTCIEYDTQFDTMLALFNSCPRGYSNQTSSLFSMPNDTLVAFNDDVSTTPYGNCSNFMQRFAPGLGDLPAYLPTQSVIEVDNPEPGEYFLLVDGKNITDVGHYSVWVTFFTVDPPAWNESLPHLPVPLPSASPVAAAANPPEPSWAPFEDWAMPAYGYGAGFLQPALPTPSACCSNCSTVIPLAGASGVFTGTLDIENRITSVVPDIGSGSTLKYFNGSELYFAIDAPLPFGFFHLILDLCDGQAWDSAIIMTRACPWLNDGSNMFDWAFSDNNPSQCGVGSVRSYLSINHLSPGRYYIIIDSQVAQAESFTLKWTATAAVDMPSNDIYPQPHARLPDCPFTPIPSVSVTPTRSPSTSRSPSRSPSVTRSASITPSNSPSSSVSPTSTASPTYGLSVTPTPHPSMPNPLPSRCPAPTFDPTAFGSVTVHMFAPASIDLLRRVGPHVWNTAACNLRNIAAFLSRRPLAHTILSVWNSTDAASLVLPAQGGPIDTAINDCRCNSNSTVIPPCAEAAMEQHDLDHGRRLVSAVGGGLHAWGDGNGTANSTHSIITVTVFVPGLRKDDAMGIHIKQMLEGLSFGQLNSTFCPDMADLFNTTIETAANSTVENIDDIVPSPGEVIPIQESGPTRPSWEIAIVIIAAVALLALVASLAFWLLRRKPQDKQQQQQEWGVSSRSTNNPARGADSSEGQDMEMTSPVGRPNTVRLSQALGKPPATDAAMDAASRMSYNDKNRASFVPSQINGNGGRKSARGTANSTAGAALPGAVANPISAGAVQLDMSDRMARIGKMTNANDMSSAGDADADDL